MKDFARPSTSSDLIMKYAGKNSVDRHPWRFHQSYPYYSGLASSTRAEERHELKKTQFVNLFSEAYCTIIIVNGFLLLYYSDSLF